MKTPPASALLIQNGTLILPDALVEGGAVLCERGKITAVGKRVAAPKNAVVMDAKGGYISPGFIDIHVHGGAGADFMDGTVAAVRTALKAHALHGTTTIFPTTTTGAPVQITAMLMACREARRTWEPGHGARIGGVHLYGPYFAPDKVGCHSREGRRAPDPEEYARWFQDDLVRIATCAAELPGAEAFYQMARKRRCLITCGHSNASWAEMAAAYKAGMRHVDHFWCAMSSVPSLRTRLGTPMQASMEQFVLAQAEMSTEVIADGMHLSPELLDFAFRMKGAERLCLVTDCNRALDMPPGRYRFGSEDDGSFFESDGRVGFVPGQGLASSVVGMDHMMRHMKKSSSATLPEAVRMASLTPAERTGMAKSCGSLEKGKLADVLVLNRKLEVQRTFIGGVEVPHE
ncbi:N-acetylglucosamine-6-phosphate deacetylase [Prosthecobacter sp.]|uniref:N-acetylglucosamine-6-phosphate deacetylase n=1 Tax=Prosthecobacter sp. TaxID=1965333 RepID=UPI0037841705